MIGISRLGNLAYRALKVYPTVVFGPKGSEAVTNIFSKVYKAEGATLNPFTKQYWKQFAKASRQSLRASERYASTFANKGFWNTMFSSVKGIPKTVAAGWRAGRMNAAKNGASALGKFWGSTKGAFSGIGKKMPIIGSLMLVAFELPNILKATYNEGIGQGILEVGKAAARIGGFTAGAAIGQVLIPVPFVGGFVGGLIGDYLASKIVGKSYSEKQAELEEKLAKPTENQPEQAVTATGGGDASKPTDTATKPAYTREQLAAFENMLYNTNSMQDDFMYKYAFKPSLNVQA